MKKRVLSLMLVLAMVLSLVACGGGGAASSAAEAPAESKEEAPAESKEEAAPAEEKEEEPAEEAEAPAEEAAEEPADAGEHENVVVDAYIVATEWGEAFDEIEARFEEKYPWIDIQGISRGGGNGGEQLSTWAAANTLPDLIPGDMNELCKTFVHDGRIEDFSQFACSEQIPQAYKDAFMVDGILMAETYGAAFSCMFYNMQILNEAGWDKVPENWQELIQCCADIAEKTDCKQPFTVAAGKTTTSWMLFELLIANACGEELGQGAYEDAFKKGTFEFNKYPEIVEKFNQLQPYILTGSSAYTEDDVTTAMTDGLAAICLAGNWNGNAILDGIADYTEDPALAAASLPCFQDEGETRWISATAETGMCVTTDPNRTEDEKEAIDLFVNFFWDPEQYRVIQNTAGNVPVIPMPDGYVVLAEQMTPLVSEMGSAPFVTMGFNLWTEEFKDTANRDIQDAMSGHMDMQAAVDEMTELVKTSHTEE
ncbi:MAG: carbohydrate ABC transporter substrate-binding protein [Lachnospiraceae bacterium]|nr:carbohydrate ABC transporter substrate-binding protein [Lachnospiraceae bacterium]